MHFDAQSIYDPLKALCSQLRLPQYIRCWSTLPVPPTTIVCIFI